MVDIRHVRMDRYKGKWRGCTESDWIELSGSKTLMTYNYEL